MNIYIYKLYKILRLLMSLACLFFLIFVPQEDPTLPGSKLAMALPGSVPVQSALKAPADPAPLRGPKRVRHSGYHSNITIDVYYRW